MCGTGFNTISATVDNTQPRLLNYYKGLGAHVVVSLSIGSTPPPSVRIEYAFPVEDAKNAISRSDEDIAHRHRGIFRLQKVVVVAAFALFAASKTFRRFKTKYS